MHKSNKTKKFDDIFYSEGFNSMKRFEKIKYMFHRIRNIMIKENPDFNDLSVTKQFNYCHTIYLITMNSKRSIMKDISLFNRNKDSDIADFDPEYGFIEPDYVEITNRNNEIIKIEKL